MSHTATHTTETEERKPPTIADIVREKTDDGRLIIDFFTDVMMDRIDGAELCHRIDAAKQLEKHKSKAAAEFLAEYRGVSCGHSINGRPNPADPCTAEDRSLVAVTLNAPPTLTQEFLTVLSGIDEFLMARLIRAQTAHGDTIIEFLDDVMQDRTDGFKTHHRIAAAKELIVHIIRDEQPAPTPSPSTTPSGEGGARPESPRRACPVLDTGSEGDSLNSEHRTGLIPPLPQGEGWGEGDSLNSERRAGLIPPLPQGEGWGEGDSIVVPAKAGTQGSSGARSTVANPARTEPRQVVVPAQAGTQGRGGGRSTAANSPRTEPVLSTVEGSQPETTNSKLETLPTRRTRTQRRREGAARAAAHGKMHEPDLWAAPIDSTNPGRSPPR